jgi:hypothetical protein
LIDHFFVSPRKNKTENLKCKNENRNQKNSNEYRRVSEGEKKSRFEFVGKNETLPTANRHKKITHTQSPPMDDLPTLYKKGSKGTRRDCWLTYSQGDLLVTVYGKEGGKMQTSKRPMPPLKSGKMTGEERALAEAKRAWLKKLDKGYLPDVETDDFKKLLEAKADSGGNNHSLLQNKPSKKPVTGCRVPSKSYLPNLAQTYSMEDKCRKYFDYQHGVYVQPKLDGLRCMAYIDVSSQDGDCTILSSRTGKQWKWLQHLRDELESFLQGKTNWILDGELYVHTLWGLDCAENNGDIERFRFISSACKTARSSPHPEESAIEFHIFDIISLDLPSLNQKERRKALDELWNEWQNQFDEENTNDSHIRVVPTTTVHSEDEMLEQYSNYIAEGYEGIVLRDSSMVYQFGKRDTRMRKHKEFYDEEFEIVGAEKAEGTQEGCVIWVCKTNGGDLFRTTIQGTLEYRRQVYDDREQHIGKMLKVRHQTPPSEIAQGVIPRFPVAIEIRDEADM